VLVARGQFATDFNECGLGAIGKRSVLCPIATDCWMSIARTQPNRTMPEFSASKIAAGAYRFLDKDYVTIGMYNLDVGRADLGDDLVYQLVKAVHENQLRILKAQSAASETLPQNVDKNIFLPFHPGAVHTYQDSALNVEKSRVREAGNHKGQFQIGLQRDHAPDEGGGRPSRYSASCACCCRTSLG
jgi:hypothetical protein